MGFKILLIVLVISQTVLCRPQFITFKDGKVGVNFGGYHAEAGLGGLLTGNSAHGGLSASAGTPYGQQAGAGLGGTLDGNGRTAGGLYAGASAGNGVGASAALGGGLDETGAHGGSGAESHAGGVSRKVVKLEQAEGNRKGAVILEKTTGQQHSHAVSGSFAGNVNFDTRNNFADDVGHVANVQQPEVVHQKTVVKEIPPVQTVKTVYKKKHVHRPHKVVYVEKSIHRPAYEQQQHEQVHNTEIQTQYTHDAPPASYAHNFDYRKFFDFGFFSNLAAGYGGPHSSQQVPATQTVYVEKHAPTIVKEVHLNKRIHSDEGAQVSGGAVASAGGVVGAGTGAGGYSATYSGNVNRHGSLFDDIFNIPISTLTAVNRLLNNKAQSQASGSFEVHKTVG